MVFLLRNAEIFCETVLTEIVLLSKKIIEWIEWGSGSMCFIMSPLVLWQQNM